MSDNFTNNVHDVMEGFQLAPSEDVWLKVQQGIQKEKKRKPKFFWWLFPLLALLVGGTYLMMQSNKQNGQVENAEQTPIQNKSANKALPLSSTITENKKDVSLIEKSKNKLSNQALEPVNVNPPSNVLIEKNETVKENIAANAKENFTKSNSELLSYDHLLNKKSYFMATASKKHKQPKRNYKNIQSNEAPSNYVRTEAEMNEQTSLDAVESIKPLQTISSVDLITQKEKVQLSISSIKDFSNFLLQTDAVHQPVIKPRKWHLSVVAGAGTSNLSSGLNGIFNAQKALSSAQSIFVAGNLPQPSAIQPNAFYNVGIEVSYDLQKRLQFNTGLHFTSFNNSIQVGSLVSSPTRFFDVNGQFLFEKDAFYTNNNNSSNTNQFNNQYIFINMPLSIDYEFARLRTMRFHVQTGFDLGYLLSNESMLFDSRTNIYYAPTTELNKWRYGLHMGASVSLMKDQLSINPMFHLGLNDLYNAGSYNNLSLSSFGLQLKLRIK